MNSKIDLLHITGNTAYGGTTFYTKSLTERALKEGYSVHYETSQAEVINEYLSIDAKIVSIKEMVRPVSPIKDFITTIKLYQYIKKNNIDIVHTHTSKGGFVGRLAAGLAGVRTVVHSVQGFAFHEHSGRLSTAFYVLLERFVARFCDKIIFVNSHDKEVAISKKIIKTEKAVLIYNGIAPQKVQLSSDEILKARRDIRNEFDLPSDALIVGAIARLSPQKGIEYLIESIPNLIEKHQNLYFLIVGTGALERKLKNRVADLNINNNVIFTGYRSDNTILLNSLDIYVLPSLWEGFSLSLLEAMAVGLPIITTNIKGNKEAVDNECGIVVSPKSSTELEEALDKYISNSSFRYNMAAKAKDKFMKNHTHEFMLDQTFALYKKLIEKAY